MSGRIRAVVALLAVALGGCSAPTRPTEPKSAQLVIDESPNPVHVGERPTLTIRETNGVGVSAQEATYRYYSPDGTLTSSATVTGSEAWFLCNNTPQQSFQHLPALGTCTLLQSTQESAHQFEFDLVVQDDNGHRLTFKSPRQVTLP